MRIAFVGDVSCGEHFFCFGHGPRSVVERGGDLFEHVRTLLNQMDVVVLNLEGPVSDLGRDARDPLSCVFRGHPDSVEQLRFAGTTVACLANNHAVQHGEACFRDTVKRLERADVVVTGLGLDADGTVVSNPSGEQVRFLTASEVPEAYHPEQREYAFLDRERLREDVARRSSTGETVVVCLHWGQEAVLRHDEEQARFAEELVAAGARIIAGHHPHVLLPIQRHAHATVAYSLGNFVFDLPWDSRLRRSAVLEVELASDAAADTVRIWPIWLERDGRPRPDGEPYALPDSGLDLYPGGGRIEDESKRKIGYFVGNLLRGNTALKLRFLGLKARGYGRR